MRAVDHIAPALCLLLLTGSMTADADRGASTPDGRTVPVAAATASPVRRLLISGHSLTDRPFPDYLAELSRADGHLIDWNVQYRWGSSLRDRTRGDCPTPWSGYRFGVDRRGRPADVLGDMARRAATGRAYDGLILTEQSSLMGNLMWNDTIGHLLDFHDRRVAAGSGGRTFLFSSWLDHDPNDPSAWIAYERAAAPVWACVAGRVNSALEEQGRIDRVELIPAAEALAIMIAEAIRPESAWELRRSTPALTLARFFVDEAHLTPTGVYYVALVSHLIVRNETDPPSWTPPEVDPAAARALRRFAARFVAAHRRSRAPTFAQCRSHIRGEFLTRSLASLKRAWTREQGVVVANLKWARFRAEWSLALRGDSARNPFAPAHGPAAARLVDPT